MYTQTAVCRWGLCPCCPGVGRCLAGVNNHHHTCTARQAHSCNELSIPRRRLNLIYIYISIYIYIYIYIYIFIYIYLSIDTYLYLYLSIYLSRDNPRSLSLYTYLYTYLHVYARTWTARQADSCHELSSPRRKLRAIHSRCSSSTRRVKT